LLLNVQCLDHMYFGIVYIVNVKKMQAWTWFKPWPLQCLCSALPSKLSSQLRALLVYNIPAEGEEYTSEYIYMKDHLITLGEKEGECVKAKLWCKLAPGALLTFLFFQHISCTIVLSGWNLTRKNSKTTHQIITCTHNWLFFKLLNQEKQILFLSLWLVIAIRSSAFRVGWIYMYVI